MGVLEDLFLRDFDVILGTEEQDGEPINTFKFKNEDPQPCLETPEFIGYVDSAIYYVSKEYTPIHVLASNPSQIPKTFEYLQASQISQRIGEYFSEELAVDAMDHLEKYANDLQERTNLVEGEASKLLQNLMREHSVESLEMNMIFENSGNYNLEENDPIIDAIHFAYDYQAGWDAFRTVYESLILLDYEGFTEDIVRNYFTEPIRSLPFVFSDLASAVSEARI